MSKRHSKVRICASELIDVDVDEISLVKHPANRVPFAILKAEDNTGVKGMFDLTNVFKRDRQPVVASVLIKGEASERVLTVLKSAGFAMDEVQMQDDVSVYPQDCPPQSDLTIVKVNDDVAFAVAAMKMETGKFAEMCAARGFYPSLSIATELLESELYKAIEKSDSPGSASEKVQNLLGDFTNFMSSLVGGLPAQVFKAEQDLNTEDEGAEDGATKDVAKSDEGSTDEGAANEDGGTTVEKDGETEGEAGGEEASEDATVEKSEDETEEGEVDASKSEEESEGDEGEASAAAPAIDTAALAAAVAKSVLEQVTPKLNELSEKVSSVEDRIEKAEDSVEDASRAVFGGVFDETRARKGESQPAEQPLRRIDTAFSPVPSHRHT